jgi:hypothetical protein
VTLLGPKTKIDRSRGRLQQALERIDQEMVARWGVAGYYVGSHYVRWFRVIDARRVLQDRTEKARVARLTWLAELARIVALGKVECPPKYPGPLPTAPRPDDAIRQARARARVEARAAQLIYEVAVGMHADAQKLYRGELPPLYRGGE